jgi:tripartite-type tricarboxylate transporter receptor subunit TctC
MFKFLQKLLLTTVMIVTTSVHAWPDRPITLIIPYPPGGGADNLARTIQNDLSQQLGQPVIIDYKPGAGGATAMRYIISSQDNHKFLFTTTDLITTASVINSDIVVADLSVISIMAQSTLVLATSPASQFSNFQSVLKNINTVPVSFGSPGPGSTSHLVLEKMLRPLTANPIIVQYRGGNPMVADTIGGHINLSTSAYGGSFRPFINSGQLIPVVVFGNNRLPAMPNVPTAKESGVDIVASISWSIFSNKTLTTSQSTKINIAIANALNNPRTYKSLTENGNEVLALSIKDSTKFINREISTWSDTIKEVNRVPTK